MSKKKPANLLPKSPTSLSINLIAVVMWVIAIISIYQYGKVLSPLLATIISLAALAIPIIALEFIFLKPYRRASTGLNFSLKQKWDFRRIIIKLLGFYTTLGMVAFIYWLIPEYRGSFYDNYYTFLKMVIPWLSLGAIPYFVFVDHFMVSPKDGYWHMGMLALGKWKKINRKILGQHVLSWMVKIFYIALMFTFSVKNTEYIRAYDISFIFQNFGNFFHFVYNNIYVVDVLFVTGSYILSLRLLDSHIRSTEPTLLGWFVALECYEPFWSFSSHYYLNYFHDLSWIQWLKDYPVINIIWGSIILLMTFIYLYADIPFGLRFSNLTNRGIITNGPYRFCKHPAYVAKNISWWFISIPFMAKGGASEAIRLSLLLLGVNFIYFLRARTEEKHLSQDSIYVEYATAMNKCSIFAWIGKLLPILQFKPNRLFNLN